MTDDNGDENVEKIVDLKLLSQQGLLYFSAITGLSFAASAIVYELVFATWGLDFTAIGTPSDVVMGGFRMLTIFSIVFAIMGTFTAIISVFISTRGQYNNKGWRRLIATVMCVLIFVLLALSNHPNAGRAWHWMLSIGPYRVQALFGIIAVLSLCIITTTFLGIPKEVMLRGFRSHWEAEFVVSLAGSMMVLFVMLSQTSYLNLGFANNSIKLPEDCSLGSYNSTGLGYKIKWIGSDSIIINCGDSSFVILNFGDNQIIKIR